MYTDLQSLTDYYDVASWSITTELCSTVICKYLSYFHCKEFVVGNLSNLYKELQSIYGMHNYRYIIKTDKLLLDNNYKIILHKIAKKA